MLAEFLSQRFSLPKSSINDVAILDDNTARFSMSKRFAKCKPNSQEYLHQRQEERVHEYAHWAMNITIVTSGLELNLNGYLYRAEPHTWFAHQVAEHSPSSVAKTAFWGKILERLDLHYSLAAQPIFEGISSDKRSRSTDLTHYPSNATTRSARSIPQIPSISIERSRNTTYY
ncbi:hypothetical protein COOONC_15840 [Cooperia oncophora]